MQGQMKEHIAGVFEIIPGGKDLRHNIKNKPSCWH